MRQVPSLNRFLNLSTRLAAGLGAAGLLLVQPAFSQDYGAAPESLDYAPAEELELSPELTMLDRVNEFFFFSERNPFEGVAVKNVDPLSKKKVARVLAGPAFKVRRENPDFDFYRYVTFYDIESRREGVFELLAQRQECHDNSDYFAGFKFTYRVRTEVRAGIEVGALGLSTNIGVERTYEMNRSLRAVPGVVAEFTPYFRKDTWYGRTLIQTYNSETGKFAFLRPEQWEANRTSYRRIFPQVARKPYPFEFEVKDAKWTFEVDREIIRKCSRAETNGTAVTRRRPDPLLPAR